MATINSNIVEAAIDNNLITTKLPKSTQLLSHPTVITSNAIFWAVQESGDGLNIDQLKDRTKLNESTLRQILQIFLAKGITYQTTELNRSIIYHVSNI